MSEDLTVRKASSDNLSVLRSTDAGPVPEVVNCLRDLLRKAEQGEIIGIAVAASCDQRCEATTYEIGAADIAALVLGLERCKLRLLTEGE